MRRSVLFRYAVLALLAASLGACGRAAPTSPDPGAPVGGQAGTNSGSAAGSAAGSASLIDLGGIVHDVIGVIVPNPRFVTGDGLLGLLGPVEYELAAARTVFPSRDTQLKSGRWTVDVSAGSLPAPKLLGISEASDGSMRVQFGPDGTRFQKPVLLTIDYSGTALDPSSPKHVPGTVPQFLYFDPARAAWVELPCVNDPLRRQVRVTLQHFSTYGLGGRAGW